MSRPDRRGPRPALTRRQVLALGVALPFLRGCGASAPAPATVRAFFPLDAYERWEAERRGQELLRRLLSEAEFEQLQEQGYLDVRSPSVSGRVYRVPRYRGVVERREPGQPTVRLCLVPDRWLPDADIVLMHKFLIEADEPRYLQLANHLAPAVNASRASA